MAINETQAITPHSRWRIAIAVSVALFGILAAVYAKPIRDALIPKRFASVVPGRVYRSGQISRWLIEDTIREHGIATIVDLQLRDIADPNQNTEVEAAQRLGVTIHRFPLGGDGCGDLSSYVDALRTMHECELSGEPVLVHCAAGTYRTGGVVAAYRILFEGKSRKEVIDELQKFDWNPNTECLTDFLNKNLPEIAERLVAENVLERVPEQLPRL
jgi:protein tyrosine/serine phosphatase